MNLQSIFSELEQVDSEFFGRLEHVSRRGLFSRVTKKKVAVAAPSILASALTSAYGQSSALPDNVVDVLNFALTLEYLDYRFYDIGTNLTMIPSQYKAAFELIRRHEPSCLPPAAAGVYAGEDKVTQKDINLQGILAGLVTVEGVTEAFDEPLTKDQVMAIVKPFLT